MTFSHLLVLIATVIINQFFVEAIISPVIISQSTIQSGSWTNCLQNCTAYLKTQNNTWGYFYFNITFATAFTEIPQVGVILTNLADTKMGNNIFGFPLNMNPTGFTLQIGYFNSSIPITLNSLAFSWIAMTSKKVFIISQVYSNASSFSYPQFLNPQNTSNLKQFLFIRGGFNQQGCNATSSLDTTNSLVVIDFKGWIPVSPLIDVGITIIVVNTEKSSDQRSYTRALSGLTQQTNLNFWDINTIPVQAGQQQNMIIGLQQYYNPNSYWTFNLTKTQQNSSLIEYQVTFDRSSSLTLQYLQIEILNCTVTNSILNYDICECINGYYENQSTCLTCDITCLTCQSSPKQCQSCNNTNLRRLSNNLCQCIDGYYEEANQALCQSTQFIQQFQECDPFCQSCDGGLKNNCLTCFQEQFREIIDQQCLCSIGYFQQQDQKICLTCQSDCMICQNNNNTNSLYLDMNCVCDQICMKHHYSLKLLGDAYKFTQRNDTIGLITGIIEPLGFLSVIFRTRQMVLTTFILETYRTKNVYMLQRMLSLFIFRATLSPDQMLGNLTLIKCFNRIDVTNKSMIYQNNPYLRLLGFSELIIYNTLPQLSILGVILILFLLLKYLNYKFEGYEDRTQQIRTQMVALVHIILEGSLLFLFTQIFMNFKSLLIDRPIHLQGIDFIASFIISLFIFTFYLGHLIKTFLDIDNHMKRKILLTDDEQGLVEYQSNDKQFIKGYKFYLQSNPMQTRPQAVFTVMSQFKKIMFCFIIVLGQGWIMIQLIFFLILGTIFLLYSLITAPRINKIIGLFDLAIQTVFLVYIISSIIDYQEFQNQTETSRSGEITVSVIMVIMSLDLLKILYKIISALILWYNKRKIKQQQEQLINNNGQNDLNRRDVHDICQDYQNGHIHQIMPSSQRINILPLNDNLQEIQNEYNIPGGTAIWGSYKYPIL